MAYIKNAYPVENDPAGLDEWIDQLYGNDIFSISSKQMYEEYFSYITMNGSHYAQDPQSHFDDLEKVREVQEIPFESPDFLLDPENLLNVFMASRVDDSKLSPEKQARKKIYHDKIREMIANGADKYAVLAMLSDASFRIRKYGGNSELLKHLESAERAMGLIKSPYDKVFDDMKDLNFFKEIVKNETDEREVAKLEGAIELLQSRIQTRTMDLNPDMLARVAKSKRLHIVNVEKEIMGEKFNGVLSKDAMEDYAAAESVEKMAKGMERERNA